MTKQIKRIAIIGNAGSGKSVLAQKLHCIFHFPVYHLDKYFWKPNWMRTDPDEYKKVHDVLCAQDTWIMDGMNLRVLEYRVQRADIILFLDMPRYLCFWRIFKRTFQYYGTEAPASAPQCPERVNWAFFAFLKWVWNFKKKYPPKIKELLKKYEKTKTIFIFTSQKDVDEWMKKLENFL